MTLLKTYTYRKTTIERHSTGWYSAMVPGRGWLKADTLKGIKDEILNTCIDCNGRCHWDAKKIKGGWYVCGECVKSQALNP